MSKTGYTFAGWSLTVDGVFGENTGRYSSKVDNPAKMDVRMDLGGTYILNEIRIYDYKGGTTADYAGVILAIQVYIDGAWKTVATCASNEAILAKRSSTADETGYKYLSFNLGGQKATQLRVCINKPVSGKSISIYEIKCFGYKKLG